MSPVCQENFQQLQRVLASADGSASTFENSAAASAPSPGLPTPNPSGLGPSSATTSAPPSPASTAATAAGGAAATAGGQREVFPAHIEKRANALFQQIYTGVLSIDEAIRLLQTFKDATNENHDVFACMLHSLFDEFRFFAS